MLILRQRRLITALIFYKTDILRFSLNYRRQRFSDCYKSNEMLCRLSVFQQPVQIVDYPLVH